MADIETIPALTKKLVTITEALKNVQDAQIESKLVELKKILDSMSPEQKTTLSTEIESAAVVIESNQAIGTKSQAIDILHSITGVRLALAQLKLSLNPEYPEPEENEGKIYPWLKSAGDGIASGAASAWVVAKQAGGTIKANALFVHKKFIAPAFTAVMEFFGVKNMQMPPVALHARSIFLNTIGSFLPKAMRETMQKSLDEEFAFHAITAETKALVADLNTVRASKTPPETPITFDFANQLTQFRLLSDAERKSIPRKVLALVKKGETAITFSMLIDEPSGEQKTVSTPQTEPKSDESETTAPIALAADGLPVSLKIEDLEKGVSFGKYNNIRIHKSPAGVDVNGKQWKLVGKTLDRRFLSYTFNTVDLDATGLNISVGTNIFFTGSGKVPRLNLSAFLDHLATQTAPKQMMGADGKYTGVDLVPTS